MIERRAVRLCGEAFSTLFTAARPATYELSKGFCQLSRRPIQPLNCSPPARPAAKRGIEQAQSRDGFALGFELSSHFKGKGPAERVADEKVRASGLQIRMAPLRLTA